MSTQSIKFKYLFDKDYQPQYTNGVYGGLNPNGELIMNFYFERFPLPYEAEVLVDEAGRLVDSEQIVSPEYPKFLRNVHSGIVMDKEVALSVYKWMHDHLLQMGVSSDELLFDSEEDS